MLLRKQSDNSNQRERMYIFIKEKCGHQWHLGEMGRVTISRINTQQTSVVSDLSIQILRKF